MSIVVSSARRDNTGNNAEKSFPPPFDFINSSVVNITGALRSASSGVIRHEN